MVRTGRPLRSAAGRNGTTSISSRANRGRTSEEAAKDGALHIEGAPQVRGDIVPGVEQHTATATNLYIGKDNLFEAFYSEERRHGYRALRQPLHRRETSRSSLGRTERRAWCHLLVFHSPRIELFFFFFFLKKNRANT